MFACLNSEWNSSVTTTKSRESPIWVATDFVQFPKIEWPKSLPLTRTTRSQWLVKHRNQGISETSQSYREMFGKFFEKSLWKFIHPKLSYARFLASMNICECRKRERAWNGNARTILIAALLNKNKQNFSFLHFRVTFWHFWDWLFKKMKLV